jgi:ActR/RegA family two-component response regulator
VTAGLIHFCQIQVIIISIREGIVHFVGDPADVDEVVDVLLKDY